MGYCAEVTHDDFLFYPFSKGLLLANRQRGNAGFSQPSFEPVNRAKRKQGQFVKERGIIA
jgi:hypothetical protein